MAKWDDLPLELAQKIAEQIYLYEDFIAFGGVCRWWRDAMKLATQSRASRQTPWLMFAERPSCFKCDLYDLCHGTVQHLELPPNPGGDCEYFSTCGLLVRVFSGSHKIVLIDPKSRRIIHQLAFPKGRYICSKFTLLGNPLTTCDYKLGALSFGEIWLWSSNDNVWIFQHSGFIFSVDMTFFNGGLYSVTHQGEVKAYSRTNDGLTERVVARLPWTSTGPGSAYMVDLAGVLLVILRVVESKDYRTICFTVWEVDVKNGKVKKVNNLNNKAVFVGSNSSFFVEASPTYCKPNCIYYTDDINYYRFPLTTRASDIGCYDLSCGMVTRDCLEGFTDPRFATRLLWVEKKMEYN